MPILPASALRKLTLTSTLLLGFAVTPSYGTTLPDPQVTVNVTTYGGGSGAISHELGSLSNGVATASALGTPDSNVFASAGPRGIAAASLLYYWMVQGPAGTSVPLDLTYSAELSLPDGDSGSVSINFCGGHCSGTALSPNSAASGVLTTEDVTGAVGTTTLTVGAAGTNPFVGGSAIAYIDPVISIDPSFAAIDPNYQQDYSIILSAGIGNSPASVPEPSSSALLAAGLIGTATVLRRRRRPDGSLA